MSRILFSLTGAFAILVGFLLVFIPDFYLSLYIAEPTPDMRFAAQRLSPVVAGLGALLFLARSLPASAFASQLALIGACVWFGIAATGLYHFMTGIATTGILIAGISELILGALFLIAARQLRPL